MSPTGIIVWDLDGTLGFFEPLQRQGLTDDPVTVLVRAGMAVALQALADAGFVHTVLTLGTPLYAELVLRGAGLRHFFALVEGLGQRGKGDAAGIADHLGLSEPDRPHRMVFVGDHPFNDQPRDPRVLFHFEPNGLSRPADDLVRLLLHLRDQGGGSLRRGFDRLLGSVPWWRRLWPGSKVSQPRHRRRTLPGFSELLLAEQPDACPVIAFTGPANPPASPTEHTFVPNAVRAQLLGERQPA